MKHTFFKVVSMIAVLAMVLSFNAFAAVGDNVANVLVNKEATDITADYFNLPDHQTYTEWAETQGYIGILGPECAVDGRYDDWGDFSRWVAKPGPGCLEVDLDGYFALETLDVYHVWANVYGDSECDWFSAEVSADGGNTWTTVIDKVTLDHSTVIVTLDASLEMGIVKSTLDMGGVVANKVRFIFDDADAAANGFNVQELQCSGKVAEKPETQAPTTQAPSTDVTPVPPAGSDLVSIAILGGAVALTAAAIAISKKRK